MTVGVDNDSQDGTEHQPIRVSSSEEGPHTFKDAVIGINQNNNGNQLEEGMVLPLKPLNVPRIEGGNLVVELDETEYKKGVGR